MRRDDAFLLDILQHARFVQQEIEGETIQVFQKNQGMRLSVQKALEIIGEASRKISAEFKRRHPEIPWKEWIDLRHELIHEYFRVDTAELWHSATLVVPGIIEMIEPLIPPDNPETIRD